MTAEATRVFLPTLRRLDRELAIPLRERLAVLRELESDLEELTRSLVARGHLEDDARRMALEALVPEGSALGELSRVHASTYARLTLRWSGTRLRLIERTALVVVTAAVLGLQAGALLGADLLRDPSPFLWPVLALSGLLFAAVAAKAFALWIKKDHRSAESGLLVILALSGLVLATGLFGGAMDLYLLAGGLESAPDAAPATLLAWLRRDLALLAVAMLASMAGGLTWFVLTQWLGVLKAARSEALGLRGNNDKIWR